MSEIIVSAGPDEDKYYGENIVDCWNCGGSGYSSHDCGEDTCCCLEPEDNSICDLCWGEGTLEIGGDDE